LVIYITVALRASARQGRNCGRSKRKWPRGTKAAEKAVQRTSNTIDRCLGELAEARASNSAGPAAKAVCVKLVSNVFGEDDHAEIVAARCSIARDVRDLADQMA
jgi:hypothetical protein